jgi:hypothetical protein
MKPPSSLTKVAWKKVLDLALYLVACTLTGTGLLLAYRLPHGQGHDGRILSWAMVGMSGVTFTPGSPM